MSQRLRQIAVIGGGFSAVALIAHVMKLTHDAFVITLFDDQSTPGLGLAYDTVSDHHLLNVRSGGMSAFADAPDHFTQWLDAHDEVTPPSDTGMSFVSRAAYGRYLKDILSQAVSRGLMLRRERVESLHRHDNGFTLRTISGAVHSADIVVLAYGHTASGRNFLPWLASPSRPEPDMPVLIKGTGLTMVDTVLWLRRLGHRGVIQAFSRRGLVSQAHVDAMPAISPDVAREAFASPVRLLRTLRAIAKDNTAKGGGWHEVIDAIRADTPSIWRGWSAGQKRQFLRHARAYWDAHRHRMAPSIARLIEGERRAGTLTVSRGRLSSIAEVDGQTRVTLRVPKGGETVLTGACLFDASGMPGLPALADPLTVQMMESGLARCDALGIGLEVDADLRVTGASGHVTQGLYALGPLTRGIFWETTAVPDIRIQAAELASHLTSS